MPQAVILVYARVQMVFLCGSKRDASLLNKSVVVWYTLDITHLPATEEWP